MSTRLLIGGAIAILAAASSILTFSGGHSSISGQAREMDLAAKATAKVTHKDGQLHVELRNFPSFESDFDAPSITQSKNGSVQVSLHSYAAGPFHRKSEQLTDLSFALQEKIAPSGTTLTFHSGDYDQVIVSAKVP